MTTLLRMELTPSSMPESPTVDPCDTGQPPPAHQPGNFDIKKILLGLIQTAAGADDLANALKDPHIRGSLNQRGVQVRAADDVGYKSLPLEIREKIRGYLIADLERDDDAHPGRRCCPRIPNYACVDTEWRAAIESITFRSIRLRDTSKGSEQDLALFARYVVGNRRLYLRHISLPCMFWEGGWTTTETKHICTDSVRRLFFCLDPWNDVATHHEGLHIELTDSWGQNPPPEPQYIENIWSEVANLPTIPLVTRFSYSNWGRLNAAVILALLSRLPQLRHTSIDCAKLDFRPWMYEEGDQDTLSRAQQFFTALPHTVPTLKCMELSTDGKYMVCDMLEIRKAAMSCSQKLHELTLVNPSREEILDFFDPFLDENFDSHAPPQFSWPNLTTLKVVRAYNASDKAKLVQRINRLMLIVGRAVRNMPLIQNLEFGMGYIYETSDRYPDTSHFIRISYYFSFELEVIHDNSMYGSRAKLSVTHDWYDSEVAEAVPSEEVKEVWRESLSKGANASLEVEVIFDRIENDDDQHRATYEVGDGIDW